MGFAEATARSVLKTVGQIFVSSEVCENCTATAAAVVEDVAEVIATAVAGAELSLAGAGGDAPAGQAGFSASDTQFSRQLSSASVERVVHVRSDKP